MAGGRGRVLVLAALAGIAALAAWGQSQEPKTASQPTRLTADELVKQLHQLEVELPNVDIAPTAEAQAKGVEACKLFKHALSRRGELDQRALPLLGSLGTRAGFAAGDPQVMLAGAKLMWETNRSDDKASEHSAYYLAWAGLLAGEPAPSQEALTFLAENAENTGMRDWARQLAATLTNCGKPIALSFQLLGGGIVRPQDYRGKVLILHFWASWCGPCRQEMPEILKFYEERKDDPNFAIVSFSSDSTVAEARAGIQAMGMTWPQAMKGSIRRSFGGNGIPHAAIISPTGRILWEGHPGWHSVFRNVADFARRQAALLAGQEELSAKPPDKKPDASTSTSPAAQPPTPAKPVESETPEAQADQKFRLAMAYLGANLPERAKAVLESVVRDFPDTPAAAQAKARLEALR